MSYSVLKTFVRRLLHLHDDHNYLERIHYGVKWIWVSALIGSVAGVGAITFFTAIRFTTTMFLGHMVGYLPPEATGEGQQIGIMSLWSAARFWLLPLIVMMGGLLSGILVFTLAPEAEGHGTDAAIGAFHRGTMVRTRVPLVKMLASAITIGTGGSAGLEGPIAHIGAGIGSVLARLLRLNAQDQRIALAAGIGAGVGAIFRAPLGGAILAIEILYISDLEVEAIIPSLLASCVGYSVFGLWSGWHPVFAVPHDISFGFPPQLLYYAVLGAVCGLLGLCYTHGFYGITAIFSSSAMPRWVKPAIGGLLVGFIGLLLPQILGIGDGWIQVLMSSDIHAMPLWMIMLLPFVKIVTTGLSIGSGGSGGIFGPGLVIGAMTGALFWRICDLVAPAWLPATPAPFVIVGMMALFGGIAHVPLAVMLMVTEMTGDLSMLAPAMIAVCVSTLLVGRTTLYKSQLYSRVSVNHLIPENPSMLVSHPHQKPPKTVNKSLSPIQ